MKSATVMSLALAVSSVSGFSISNTLAKSSSSSSLVLPTSTQLYESIVSPFDEGGGAETVEGERTEGKPPLEGPLELTWENVEAVLDEMRPYLIQDGGNVVISEIDGPVVRLELQGACGTCPSSTQTMKMGLERGLREKIPEIQEVVQSMPEGPPLCDDEINVVLDGVRPFLQVAGGTIDIDRIEGEGSLQPTVWLEMKGSSASLNSVKLEIAQRLQRHFMMAGLQIQWNES
ncbi:unnamed protein product [Cylindrotheca closterium]|uniref:NIF system FeS cluster assembly NifU C-terminal domain-containing protein n=1 Tax=Cylindrotheca closterium TaxID=2856 RepID=A0AAD2CGM0_9STRA|nr:unnamed protein product [Cylindrotheca closterium]